MTALTTVNHVDYIDPLFVLRGHQAAVNCITPIVLNDTVYIATGDSTGIIRIWSLLTRRSILVYNVNEQQVLDDNVRIIQKLMHNKSDVNSILSLHHYNNSMVAVQCKIGIILIYQIIINDNNIQFELHNRVMTQQYSFCKCLIHNNILYSTGDIASMVYMYDLNTLQLLNTLQCEKLKDSKVSVIDDSNDDNVVVNAENELDKMYGMLMHITVLYSTYMLCGMESGHINLYNINTKKLIQSYKAHKEPVMSISCKVNPDNDKQYVALSCSAGNNIVQFAINFTDIDNCSDISDQTVLQYVADIKQHKDGISDICIRNDIQVYATGCWDNHIRIYRLHDNTLLCTLKFHTAHVYCIQFIDMTAEYRDLGIVVSGSKDGKICVWQLYNKQQLPTLPSNNVLFKPQSRAIDTSAFDRVLLEHLES